MGFSSIHTEDSYSYEVLGHVANGTVSYTSEIIVQNFIYILVWLVDTEMDRSYQI